MITWLLPFVGLFACPDQSQSGSADSEADARVEATVRAWQQGVESGKKAMEALHSPVEREAVLRRLADNRNTPPNPELCKMLAPASQDYCLRLSQRPHLWEPTPMVHQGSRQRRNGPSDARLQPPRDYKAPLLNEQPLAPDCAEELSAACADSAALDAAKQGDADRAGRYCLNIPAGKLQAECFFTAAELMISDADDYPDAVDLCLAAGEFQVNCLDHLTGILADQAPPADPDSAKEWQSVIDAAKIISVTWGQRLPELEQKAVQRYWAESTFQSMRKAAGLSAAPFEHLPAEAQPHLRAAAAIRFLEDRQSSDATLTELQAELGSLLSHTEASTQPVEPNPLLITRSLQGRVAVQPGQQIFRDPWPHDLPRDLQIPAIVYIGEGRRPWSQDPDIDLLLAVLEGLGQLGQLSQTQLSQAREHSDELVGWSALRLQKLAPVRAKRRPESGNK